MPDMEEMLTMQKSTVLDLKLILKDSAKKNPDKLYTAAELDDMLDAYVRGLEAAVNKSKTC